jgi:hypothetical protein
MVAVEFRYLPVPVCVFVRAILTNSRHWIIGPLETFLHWTRQAPLTICFAVYFEVDTTVAVIHHVAAPS